MHPRLKSHLMPWTLPTFSQKFLGIATLVMFPLSVSMFFTSLFLIPALIVLSLSAAGAVIFGVQHLRAARTNADRMLALICAKAVHDGQIEMQHLPGEIQENIATITAKFHLQQSRDEQ